MTKLALIPPFALLGATTETDYQLMLPHLLRNPDYTEMYQELCSDPNQYVILDNGAAEGEEWDLDQLLVIAETMGVDEVVVPDVMGDSTETFVEAMKAWEEYGEKEEGPKLGVVATGKSYTAAFNMITSLWRQQAYFPVVYIPRLLVTSENSWIRINMAKGLLFQAQQMGVPEPEFHFLGASPIHPAELFDVALEAPFVRGMDTSLPFNYGFKLASVAAPQMKPISRPEGYFEQEVDTYQEIFMRANVKVMKEWIEK